MISEELKILLVYSKRNTDDVITWKILSEKLKDLYFHELKLKDVIYILVNAYDKVLKEPRFEVYPISNAELILVPIKNIDLVTNSADLYSLEDFYNTVVRFIIGQMAISRVDWCKEELDL